MLAYLVAIGLRTAILWQPAWETMAWEDDVASWPDQPFCIDEREFSNGPMCWADGVYDDVR